MADDVNDSIVDGTVNDSADDMPDDGGWPDRSDVGEDVEIGAEQADPEPASWARPDVTGVARVDAVIGELDRLDGLPAGEHVAVYEGLHRQLQDALADLDGV
jgi:hypothetical protein